MARQASLCSPGNVAGDRGPLRVLVVTVVHDPDDARIRFRQIGAMRDAGIAVTYAAPFSAYGRTPPDSVEAVDLPRASGRHRAPAVLAARRLVRSAGPDHDVVLLHDPELLATLTGRPGARPLTIWDVHEDTAAAIGMKRWLPPALRPVAAFAMRRAERWAERRCELILAEEGYRGRFRRPHPVVPNSAILPAAPPPPAGTGRVVYLGRLTAPRGALEMLELGRLLAPDVRVELIGPADADVAPAIASAVSRGWVTHHGFVPNRAALELLRGALAGLSMLHDEPNYASSRPTKVMEYMGLGVPVVTTPNAASAELVRRYGSGLVVPFADVPATAAAIRSLRADEGLRLRLGAAGRAAALRDLDWHGDGERFAALLQAWAKTPHP